MKNWKKFILSAFIGLFCIGVTFVACDNGTTNDSPTGPTVGITTGTGEGSFTLGDKTSITLTGSVDHPDGISSYGWTQKSGPSGATITSPANTTTTVTGITKAGTYVFELAATANNGVSSAQTVTITVAPMLKTITVPAITTVTNPFQFGTVLSLGGWDANFLDTEVTYTLAVDGGTPVSSTISTSVSATGLSNGAHTITQTFYYSKGTVSDGSRNGTVGVFSNTFGAFTESFPVMTLLLSKTEL